MKNCFNYFKNEDCAFFPCHETDGEDFNCLFCYCPLYALGDSCGGNFKYIEDGIKDCSQCLLPHNPNGYSYIISRYEDIKKLAAENRTEKKDV